MSVFSFSGIWDIRRNLKKHFFGVEGLCVYLLLKKRFTFSCSFFVTVCEHCHEMLLYIEHIKSDSIVLWL